MQAFDRFIEMPWRNGGGVTSELFKEDEVIRLSVAKVERDGPFSVFEGIDRHLLILNGEGVYLNDFKLVPNQVHRFAGESPIFAKLVNGPITDFNVMVHRNFGSASVTLFSGLEWNSKFRTFAYDHEAALLLEAEAGESFSFEAPRQRIIVELISK